MKWGVAIYELVSEGKPPAMYMGPHRVLYLIHHLLLLFYISFFLSITPFFVNHWRMALEMMEGTFSYLSSRVKETFFYQE